MQLWGKLGHFGNKPQYAQAEGGLATWDASSCCQLLLHNHLAAALCHPAAVVKVAVSAAAVTQTDAANTLHGLPQPLH